ncbi:MAG: GNAT family N-acetyltransferase [Gracilimonas sp.]|uniref:GNAT family N-acetyltransferase n=1 Tax=Gracilimonas TaxID=649462 RepID=UPI001B11975F|nr:GNAT family N-acetyltransferase [Gracilimonas sp.]MBO6585669.1 GNAT family N-acetyltransferase [Gracilimonas sp.]MBO6616666.1 GNAT family N-acetyltransferase [Gracilimonas sp.]
METIHKSFEELSSVQLQDIFRLRQNVFIIEQQCFYEDIDGADAKAEHLLIYDEEKLAAYLRIFPYGVKYKNEANMGRIVVDPEFRGTGLGERLIKKGIELCDKKPIRIEAQAALEKYYNGFGFKAEGEVYVVDEIDHLQMVLA